MGQAHSAAAQDSATLRRSTLSRRSAVLTPPTITEDCENVIEPSTSRLSRRQTLSAHRLSRLTLNTLSSQQQDVADQASTRPGRLRRLYNTVTASSSRPRHVKTLSSSARTRDSSPTAPQDIAAIVAAGDGDDILQVAQPHTPATAAVSATQQAQSRRSSLRLPGSLAERLSSFRASRPHVSPPEPAARPRRPAARPLEDNTALLSRLLSVAAAATAATLLEGNEGALAEARGPTIDGDDGSFGSFLQSLESGRLASALRATSQASEEPRSATSTSPSHAPLNFFRMFRFGTTTNPASQTAETPLSANVASPGAATPSSTAPAGAPATAGTEGRMIPIIIVGIRAVTPGAAGSEESDVPPFLDALSTLPASMEANATPVETPISAQTARQRRRASMGGITPHSIDQTSRLGQRNRDRYRPMSVASYDSLFSSTAATPATPATPRYPTMLPRLSTTAQQQSTMRRRSPTSSSRRTSIIRTTTTTTHDTPSDATPITPNRTARQRRVSESDQHSAASFASRRNGIGEPDNLRPANENARSWIIYVLGGSYPENHPILTTPSLFTDSPTYEDMMLLSALLGPAKAPVATEKDVQDAGGVYKIRLNGESGTLHAVADTGDEKVALSAEQRCLVCLSDFEVDEQARRLGKCGHLFHRECIDEVSSCR